MKMMMVLSLLFASLVSCRTLDLASRGATKEIIKDVMKEEFEKGQEEIDNLRIVFTQNMNTFEDEIEQRIKNHHKEVNEQFAIYKQRTVKFEKSQGFEGFKHRVNKMEEKLSSLENSLNQTLELVRRQLKQAKSLLKNKKDGI